MAFTIYKNNHDNKLNTKCNLSYSEWHFIKFSLWAVLCNMRYNLFGITAVTSWTRNNAPFVHEVPPPPSPKSCSNSI